jgi:signal transduction histidine kinase
LTDSAIALDRLGEVLSSVWDRDLDQPAARLAEEARPRVGALVSRISRGVADYGLAPLRSLMATARVIVEGSDRRTVVLEVCPTDLVEGEISAQAVGRLSQALRDPVSKLALFANLVTHGPADRQSYYEATLSAEIQSLGRLIDQLSRLACLMGPANGPLASLNLHQLADIVRDELGSKAGDSEPLLVTTDEPDRTVRANGRLVGEAVQNILAAFPHVPPACKQVEVHLAMDEEWLAINLRTPALEVSADSLTQRFEPFFGGAMDLGPTLARTIISRHDGFVTVKDGVGGGIMSLWLASLPAAARNSRTDEMT